MVVIEPTFEKELFVWGNVLREACREGLERLDGCGILANEAPIAQRIEHRSSN